MTLKFRLSSIEHLEKARRNQEILFNHLLNFVEKCPEWVTVVAFYSALHFVDAYFAKLNLHFQHHQERNSEISESLKEIFGAYYRLYDLSVNSRYGSMKDNPTADEAMDTVRNDLPKVVEFIQGFVH